MPSRDEAPGRGTTAAARRPFRPFRWLARGLVGLIVVPARWLRLTAWRYVQACWLTWMHVDEWQRFPAFKMQGIEFPFRIVKERGAYLKIDDHLLLRAFPGANAATTLYLARDSRVEIRRWFLIGENVRINLAPRATLIIEGNDASTVSGMPNNCTVYVKQSVTIRKDSGLSWYTLVMDSDWHLIGGKMGIDPVVIGEHVWVGPNTRILKGAHIGNDCIVASGSIVMKGEYPDRTLIAGIPAKVLKTDIPLWTWEWTEEHK